MSVPTVCAEPRRAEPPGRWRRAHPFARAWRPHRRKSGGWAVVGGWAV